MLRKSNGIFLLSNIHFCAQFFHTSYKVYKKTADIDQSTINVIDPFKKQTLSQLYKRFQCSIKEAFSLYDILQFPKQNLNDIVLKKAWLTRKGASTLVIRLNCEMLLHTSGELNWQQNDMFSQIQRLFLCSENLQNRFDALKGVHWKKTDDFLPLLMMDEEVIFKVRSCESSMCLVNRIYELSERLSVSFLNEFCHLENSVIKKLHFVRWNHTSSVDHVLNIHLYSI